MASRTLGKYVQDPNETLLYTIDYSDWLENGETLDTVTFAVSPTTSSPLTVSDDEIQAGDASVAFYVSGGLNGKQYTITVTAVTSLGQTKEDAVLMVIRG